MNVRRCSGFEVAEIRRSRWLSTSTAQRTWYTWYPGQGSDCPGQPTTSGTSGKQLNHNASIYEQLYKKIQSYEIQYKVNTAKMK